MLDAKLPRWYLWLDVCKLITQIKKINQEIVVVKYFTALRDNEEPSTVRKKTYIEALETLELCEVIKGKYKNEDFFCQRCRRNYKVPKEKMTDVNIAIELINDAYKDKFDQAILLSGDSDLTPVVEMLREEFDDKRIIVVFPPARTSDDLKEVANGFLRIGRANISQSDLPNRIRRDTGGYIVRPPEWSKITQ